MSEDLTRLLRNSLDHVWSILKSSRKIDDLQVGIAIMEHQIAVQTQTNIPKNH